MIRTGVFGGSFNPIHKGHLAVATSAVNQNLVDETWILVSPHNPLKVHDHLLDDDFRLKLAKQATEDCPKVSISDFEFHLPRPSYTIHTLEKLSKAYSERQFSLIIGADNWIEFHRWYHYKEILDRYSIIIYPRENSPVVKDNLPDNVTLLDLPLYPISSTAIRERLRRNESASEWLPEEVERELQSYLREHPQTWQ